MAETIEALVDAGKASAGPPLGPALGPLGVNIGAIVQEINNKTKGFTGMKVPVKIVIDDKTKEFEITVGTPPTSALLLKELGVVGPEQNKDSMTITIESIGQGYERARKVLSRALDPRLTGEVVEEPKGLPLSPTLTGEVVEAEATPSVVVEEEKHDDESRESQHEDDE